MVVVHPSDGIKVFLMISENPAMSSEYKYTKCTIYIKKNTTVRLTATIVCNILTTVCSSHPSSSAKDGLDISLFQLNSMSFLY